LRCAAISDEGQWCCRLVHADETNERRSAIPGLTWTSDIALHCNKDKIHFAMRVFATATNHVEQIIYIRPRLIADIAKQFQIVETMPIDQKRWKEIGNSDDIEQLYDAVISENRHLPIVLIIKEPNENLFPILFKPQFDINRQSILAFAHIVALPENWSNAWTQKIGNNLTIPRNGIRIYYPYLVSDEDSAVRHPGYSLEEINTWQWDNQYGMSALAIYLKDCLSEHATMKPMDWGSCLFYPKMRLSINENRKKFFIESQNNAELLELLTNENKEFIQRNEELAKENKSLEYKIFELQSRLDATKYHSQTKQETLCPPAKVKIRKKAKEELEKIQDETGKKLREITQNCRNKDWRKLHWDPWQSSELTVIKMSGKNVVRIAGFESDGVFFITHIFDDHNDYEHTLKQTKIKQFAGDEYVDI
jgi:hypothetical protein